MSIKYNNCINIFDYNIGTIPYKPYNVSIIDVYGHELNRLTGDNKRYIVFIFFVALVGNRYGTMSWLGISSYENVFGILENKKMDSNFWIVKPHLIQNDLGPKCADLRIFKTVRGLNVIGYTRLADKSNTPGIPDYYVRTVPIDFTVNNDLKKTYKDVSFKEVHGGCFPGLIKNNYTKFIENVDDLNDRVEFFMVKNENVDYVYPHKSKHRLMPEKIKLNGIEVSFSKSDSNTNKDTHISRKNIIPLQHKNKLKDIGCFIDASPHDNNHSLITIQNLYSSNVYYVDTLIIEDKFESKKYKGSTPFIEIEENLWVAILHQRINDKTFKYNLRYEYIFTFFNSKKINGISVPNKCTFEIKLDISKIIEKQFIFITGLVVNSFKNGILDLLISYGVSDSMSGLSNIQLDINGKN